MVWLTVDSSQIWYRVVNNTRTPRLKYCLWLDITRLAWDSSLHDHIQTLHSRRDSSGRVISPTQKPLPDNTQPFRGYGEILTYNPNKRAAVCRRLRPHSHCQHSRTEPKQTEQIRPGKETYVMKWKHSHCTPNQDELNQTEPDRARSVADICHNALIAERFSKIIF